MGWRFGYEFWAFFSQDHFVLFGIEEGRKGPKKRGKKRRINSYLISNITAL